MKMFYDWLVTVSAFIFMITLVGFGWATASRTSSWTRRVLLRIAILFLGLCTLLDAIVVLFRGPFLMGMSLPELGIGFFIVLMALPMTAWQFRRRRNQ